MYDVALICILARMSHKFSTARPNPGTGAGIAGIHARASHRCMPTLQGVDPASPANLHETRTSTRPSIARYEFCEKCGLATRRWLLDAGFWVLGSGFCKVHALGELCVLCERQSQILSIHVSILITIKITMNFPSSFFLLRQSRTVSCRSPWAKHDQAKRF